ncbi:MAG: peptide transporter permease [Firmicutes bacterium]|nr:peptide transporter permease [Bacillota bacterium]
MLLRRLARRKTSLIAFLFLILVVLIAIGAPLIVRGNLDDQNLGQRLKPPGFHDDSGKVYTLGTDQLGRDLVPRLIYGARVSLLVGLSSVTLGGGIGLVLGLISGFYGGKVDAFIMRIADIQLAFPFLLLALALVSILGPSLLNVILVLSLTSWISYAKVIRGAVLSVRNREFVEAARALGATGGRIIRQHVLPNVFSSFLVIASCEAAALIIAESSLSYLGLGVPTSVPTWGGMLADGREYITDAWWIALVPGLTLMATALSFNILGDGARDALDPTQRNNRK